MPFTPAAHQGILHHFAPRLFAFAHAAATTSPSAPSSSQQQQSTGARNYLLFLGGLGDDLLHPTYPSTLATHLPAPWSLAELHLRCAGQGWTTSSLPRDADDLASAVTYFRSLQQQQQGSGSTSSGSDNKGRIVLMGHSTGAQVCMEYLTATTQPKGARVWPRPRVDGVVLQGGISDREGLAAQMEGGSEALQASVSFARKWEDEGRGEDVLPNSVTGLMMGASPCARRWVSLAGFGGGDDYFSSDLGRERFARTFGRVGALGVPVCCVLSGEDENMPGWVDKEALLGTWREAVVGGGGVWDEEGSGVVAGASHNLNKSPEGVVAELSRRVTGFVKRVGGRSSAHADGAGGSSKDEKL